MYRFVYAKVNLTGDMGMLTQYTHNYNKHMTINTCFIVFKHVLGPLTLWYFYNTVKAKYRVSFPIWPQGNCPLLQ